MTSIASYSTSSPVYQAGDSVDESFVAAPSKGANIFARSSTTLATVGCAFAVALALVGAAYALDAPASATFELVPKGDRVASTVQADPSEITVEEVNLDAGISNLVRIETSPEAAL